jgi:hypothetical protein
MKTRPIGEAIDITVRQHQDHAAQQGQRRPDPEVLRARICCSLTIQDQKQNR